MPTRIIRDGILSSERVNALSERAELFYRRLMSVVDDYGRFSANLTLLCSTCYPMRRATKEDVVKAHLAECEKAGLVVIYTVEGKTYLQMQDFGQRVQSKSKYPEPNGEKPKSTVNHGEPPEPTGKNGLVGVEDVNEDEVDIGAAPPATAILLPLNTGAEHPVLETQLPEYKTLYPAVDVMGELRKMRGWLLANKANRKTAGGIERFIANWLAKEQDRARIATTAPQVNTSMGASPQKVKTPDEERADRIQGLRQLADYGDVAAKQKLKDMGIPA